ncbi:SPBc2 prophage-derived endonuclease YokF [Lysinibacillus sphaericus]|uniref:SPBc2 prophage-derived endonuclease YokF n=1 Tax=Lysinibacillus sphaericus TaxID=1421 RepID=A0A2S5D4I4_LYSSH|nr:thermonuclease family protein [Lysinibacillus sphaericus]POZ57951.1 SPBc2 prophage-derived endonuclease YokF [Lysinibacillus sphaericus]
MNLKKLFLALFFSTLLISGCTEEASTGNGKTEDIQGIVASTKESAEKHDVSKFEEYELQEIIDGDTIRIKYNGSSEKIRFLLVDTPETNHKTLGVQPFGPEAKEFTKQLLAGQDTVYLEFDVSYRDKYKRLLAYVYTKDGISVQEQLLKNGLARVAYIYEPNTKHVDWFKSIQKTAQQSAIGIWSVEDYVTNSGYDKEAYNNAVKEENPENPSKASKDESNNISSKENCTIKGNVNSKGNKIYHMPGQRDYDNTVAEEMFCTKEDAEAAGFIPARQ